MSTKSIKNINDKARCDDVGEEKYIFKLFVAGNLPIAAIAIKNSKAIFEKYLKGRYQLEIIDVYEQPSMALSENIIALPLLIQKLPLPEVRMIGDLSDTKKVLDGFYII